LDPAELLKEVFEFPASSGGGLTSFQLWRQTAGYGATSPVHQGVDEGRVAAALRTWGVADGHALAASLMGEGTFAATIDRRANDARQRRSSGISDRLRAPQGWPRADPLLVRHFRCNELIFLGPKSRFWDR
jgi:hypothetical protein